MNKLPICLTHVLCSLSIHFVNVQRLSLIFYLISAYASELDIFFIRRQKLAKTL